MKKIHYYLFAVRWLWNNQWSDTRQKWKALAREWEQQQTISISHVTMTKKAPRRK